MSNPTYDVSIDIDAPVDVVYDYVADFPRHVEWNNQPVSMTTVSEGPTEVGSVYRTDEQGPRDMPRNQKMMLTIMRPVTKALWGSPGYTEATIMEMDRPNRLAWQARLPSSRKGDLMRMNWSIDLTLNGSGTTLVQHCEICPPPESPLLRMMGEERLAEIVADAPKEALANLENLKQILESGNSST